MKEAPFTPLFLAVKLFDIGFVTTIYFIIAIVFAKIFDYVYGKFNPEEYKNESLWKLGTEIVIHIFLLAVLAYAMRNVVELIPFPLEGIAGFQHHRLKELEGGEIMALLMILFQNNLHEKIEFFGEMIRCLLYTSPSPRD